jgi:hypothetical protein
MHYSMFPCVCAPNVPKGEILSSNGHQGPDKGLRFSHPGMSRVDIIDRDANLQVAIVAGYPREGWAAEQDTIQ